MSDRTAAESIVLHLPTGSGRLSEQAVEAVQSGFREAVELAGPLLGLAHVDVMAIDSPDQSIPGWGCGGYTHSAYTIVLALDPLDDGLTAERVRATVVHELHHIARERGPGCGTSLRERLVSEGLAMLFEEEVLGVASEFAHVTISESDIDWAITRLDEDPADDGLWFFRADSVPLWFGYTLGYRWAKEHGARHSVAASELATTEAAVIAPA
ncbi:DUF2268 domain-containing putative Zn-dependent protease [Kytococcus sedentarius]|uniref:DUF2268 domain-containing putative Zn-dependent protease n=1 Tax=Kytococcus sedentarius TaxID=1276 RepID=UPI0019500CEB|nr:DUF2268 domain-containing putative Zn-dependent protease [Kytococcus sedentarius]QRO87377.1 hypothetical protein I6J30_11350 [Kytococcus sedentarius]